MNNQKHQFVEAEQSDFFKVLRSRINDYFEKTGRSRHADGNMVVKTVVMFAIYFVPYFLMITGTVTDLFAIGLMWFLMGIGKAGIGLSIMHDANHHAYSQKKWLNRMLGYSLNLIGGNAEIWKMQHNHLHHTYTNIVGGDEDISPPGILRFSPHEKKRWVHKFQFLYAWFLYAIFTLSWITIKEFLQLVRYRKMNIIRSKKHFRELLISLIVGKLFYYTYALVLPLLLLPISPGWVILFFLMMHFITGTILSLIFQTAHVMPNCQFVKANDKGVIESNWAIHEMTTTANYAPSSRIFSWFVGGLNYQIEHHLFANICHVHYRHISKTVKETAREFDVPYNTHSNFALAVWRHLQMLYKLGRMEQVHAVGQTQL